MKNNFKRLLAVVLVICMVCPLALNAEAAGWKSSSSSSVRAGLGSLLKGFFEILEEVISGFEAAEEDQSASETEPETKQNNKSDEKNNNKSDEKNNNKNGDKNNNKNNDKNNDKNNNKNNKNDKNETVPATEPSTEPATEPSTEPATEPSTEPATEPSTEPATEPGTEADSEDPGMDLVLVEDQDTVSPMVMMRAAVYAADENDPVAQAELQGANVVYYPVTLIDYDKEAIDQAMADLDVKYAIDHNQSTSANGWKWKGLYFGAGAIYSNSGSSSPDRTKSRTGIYETGEPTYTQATNVKCSALANGNVTDNPTSYFYLENGEYYPVTVTRTSETRGGFLGFGGTTYYTYTLRANGKQIWSSGEITSTNTNVGVILYTREIDGITVTSSNYEDWVKWGGNDEAEQGGYIHSGMVTGLVDGVPQFAESYASQLFDSSDVDGKHVYTNVGLPFILGDDGYYTFDSSVNGAYGVASGENMTLLDAPIVQHGFRSGSTKVWSTSFMPFNAPVSDTKQNTDIYQTDGTEQRNASVYRLDELTSGYNPPASYNHYFSMIASVPFTMTENGRINPSDDNSDAIAFEFSGDDDVWVFVDDVLVLDLGGIHDAVTGTIDFAANEVTFRTADGGVDTGDATPEADGGFGTAGAGEEIVQCNIFNDGDTVGKLNTTRSTFAATDNHTLTIVYVERGANLSNSKIRFNLPQKDYIAVSKHIDEKLYKQTDENVEDGTITAELFETLNQRNFTYVLYENGVEMSGKRFSRYDANGNFVGNGSTASDGTFNVKNGETVRFYDVDFDGENSYYVAELDPDAGTTNNAWGTATWAHTISTAYGESAEVTATTKPADYYVSQTITTLGSEEAVDVIYFTNTNKLLSPVADIANDEYVIDFGLPVELNPLANDTYSATGNQLTLTGISMTAPTEDNSDPFAKEAMTGKYGTLSISGDQLIYTLNKQMTGADVFYYQVGLTTGELNGVYGTITIMPASTMYYEESFDGLNLTGEWTNVGTAQGGYQEEGRVGTTSDSPYGSDVLYMNNSGDSYGTSKYINTSDKGKIFSYTFTGTGTALYARTSDKSAYMIITVKDEYDNVVSEEWRRNTIYKPVDESTELKDNTLYNIPVYVYTADAYGTYTVEVKLNMAMLDAYQDENGNWIEYTDKYSRGCDFHLDGIRVYNPANAYTDESPDSTKIEDAYRRDGEAYITVDSLRNKLLLDSTKYTYVLDEEGKPVTDEYGDYVIDGIEWDGVNYVVFTDVNGEIKDAQTYQSAGPKEEVYMKAGQSVAFSLENWDQNQNKVFLGIKAPAGSGSVSINGQLIEIKNTTDIYYDITKYANVSNNVATFTIKAESALISVSTVKVTGTAEFSITSGNLYDIPEDSE